MRTLEVDDEVYTYLLNSASYIGEDASSILRRLLKLPSANGHPPTGPGQTPPEETDPESSALLEFVRSANFLANRSATDRYLAVLGFVHERRPHEFDRVLQLAGRRRVYFGRTREEIARSGRSTNPQRIPGSEYWALTNADTEQKKDLLRRALRLVGYKPETIRETTKLLV